MRLRQPDVQLAVAAAGGAVTAANVVGLAGKNELLSHDEFLFCVDLYRVRFNRVRFIYI
jgi:hypothetical protein